MVNELTGWASLWIRHHSLWLRLHGQDFPLRRCSFHFQFRFSCEPAQRSQSLVLQSKNRVPRSLCQSRLETCISEFRDKQKQGHVHGTGKRGGRYPSRRGSLCFLHLLYNFFSLRFFLDTNGVFQQVAVMTSHLQVKEALGRVGIFSKPALITNSEPDA